MKKLLSILLVCVLIASSLIIGISAEGEPYAVFYDGDGYELSGYEQVPIVVGDPIYIPSIKTDEWQGLVFQGWYYDAELTEFRGGEGTAYWTEADIARAEENGGYIELFAKVTERDTHIVLDQAYLASLTAEDSVNIFINDTSAAQTTNKGWKPGFLTRTIAGNHYCAMFPENNTKGLVLGKDGSTGHGTFIIRDKDGNAFIPVDGKKYHVEMEYYFENVPSDAAAGYHLNISYGLAYQAVADGTGIHKTATDDYINPRNIQNASYDLDSNKVQSGVNRNNYRVQASLSTATSYEKRETVALDFTAGQEPEMGAYNPDIPAVGIVSRSTKNGSTAVITRIEVYEVAEVTYYLNGAPTVVSQAVDSGASTQFDAPGAIVKWYKDQAMTQEFTGTVTNGLILYGNSTVSYAVEYYYGDKKLNPTVESEGSVGENVTLWQPLGANETGLAFQGWYTDTALTKPVTATSATIGSENIKYYGKFVPYGDDLHITNFTEKSSKIEQYGVHAGSVFHKVALNATRLGMSATETGLILNRRQTFSHTGTYIIHDPATGTAFIPEPGATYRVSVTYKGNGAESKGQSCVRLGYDPLGMSNETQGPNISGGELVNMRGWQPATDGLNRDYYKTNSLVPTEATTLTADFTIPEEGPVSSGFGAFGVTVSIAYAADGEANTPTITLTEITVTKIHEAATVKGGASVLKPEEEQAAGKQALRVYFSYKAGSNAKVALNVGDTIIPTGTEDKYQHREVSDVLGIVARGILVKAATNDAVLDASNVAAGVIKSQTSDFSKCWDYDKNTDTIVFSNYLTGFDETMLEKELTFVGYILLEDGTYIYSEEVTYSVAGVKAQSPEWN